MNLQHDRDQLTRAQEECQRLHASWLWFLVLGAAIMIAGFAAIGSAFVATLATVLIFGALLLAGGVIQLVNAFLARTWEVFFLNAMIGVLHFIIGGLMIEHPLRAAEGLTLMLAVAFIFGGAARLLYGAAHGFAGRGWVLLNGLITFCLGVSIWRQWPESSLWVIGLFIGIELVLSGWSWVMVGIAVRTIVPLARVPEVRIESSASATH